MKKLILCYCFILIAFVSHAQDKQAIINVMHIQQAAWNRGDIDSFMQGYWKSDSLLFVGKTAPTHGWQATLNNYKKAIPIKQQWALCLLIL